MIDVFVMMVLGFVLGACVFGIHYSSLDKALRAERRNTEMWRREAHENQLEVARAESRLELVNEKVGMILKFQETEEKENAISVAPLDLGPQEWEVLQKLGGVKTMRREG